MTSLQVSAVEVYSRVMLLWFQDVPEGLRFRERNGNKEKNRLGIDVRKQPNNVIIRHGDTKEDWDEEQVARGLGFHLRMRKVGEES